MSRILHHVDRKDFKKTRQKQIGEQKECDAQKLKEWQEAEATRPYKSNWREEIQLQESDWTPVAGSIANSSSQTFQYGGEGGPTATFSGLGGVEAYPSTVSVSGETLNTPNYSQLALQGYAPPLGGVQRQTKQTENERIDAEIIKLEEQIKQLQQKISDLNEKQIATEPQYTGMSHGDYIDKTNEINDKWNEKTGPLGEIIYGSSSDSEKKAAYAKLDVYESARIKELDALDAEYKNQTDEHLKAQNDHFAAYTAKIDSALAKQEALRVKIAELEKQRPINQQLDASQQAYPNLPMMGARVQPVVGTHQNPLMNTVFDAAAKLTGKEPAKKVFDYYNDTFLKNLSSNPPGSSPSNPVDMTKMMDKSEMNLIQSVVDTVMSDVNLTKNIERENVMNDAFEDLTKTILVPTGLRFDAQSTATPNTRNIIGQLDRSKFDGFHIQKNGRVILRKSYDFDNKPGDDDFAAAGGVGGIGASLYARYKGTPDYAPRGGETPSMHLQVMFNPTRNKRNRSGEKSQASSLASQASSAVGLRRNRRGRVVESTWSKLKKHR